MAYHGKLQIDKTLCTGCGLCVQDCISGALSAEPGAYPGINSAACFSCGHCIAVCPTGAVTLDDPAQAEVLPYDSTAFTLSPETLLNAIKFRRSVRRFTGKPLEHAVIERIIEAGRYTPTGSNRQNVSYIVLEKDLDRLERAALADCDAERHAGGRQAWVDQYMPGDKLEPGRFFRNATAVILVVSDDAINASLAASSMELMAQALGVGVFYCGLFMRALLNAPALQAELGIAPPAKLINCLCLGHPAVRYHRTVPRNPANITWR